MTKQIVGIICPECYGPNVTFFYGVEQKADGSVGQSDDEYREGVYCADCNQHFIPEREEDKRLLDAAILDNIKKVFIV